MTADEAANTIADAEVAICEALREVQARGIPVQELAVVIDVPVDGGENTVHVVPRRGIEMPDEEQSAELAPIFAEFERESPRDVIPIAIVVHQGADLPTRVTVTRYRFALLTSNIRGSA